MRKYRALVLGSGVMLALLALSSAATAADHRDGAAVKMDPATDINDVYTWMSADGARVYLAMTVFPVATAAAKFSDTAKYVFHLRSAATYGAASTKDVNIICTFTAAQVASCWATSGTDTLDYVTGDAGAEAGITSTSGKMKLFAGLRDDPFFFNLDGFKAVAATVATAAPGLVKDAAGCPTLDAATSTALVTQLKTKPAGGAPENFFHNLNTLAIVLSVDKSMVTPGGPIVGVWGSTHR